jgi:aspartate kinase
MKFGGASVGSGDRILATARLIAGGGRDPGTPATACRGPGQAGRAVVAVVSAMSGVTDMLVLAARAAASGRTAEMEQNLARIRKRYSTAAAELLCDQRREEFESWMLRIIGQVENTCEGISRLAHCPGRAMDAVTGCGEKLSALLLAAVLREMGERAEALDASTLIVTDDNFGEAAPQFEPTAARLRQAVLPLVEAGTIPVITGFIGCATDGAPTTLGRGGSDYSATIVAACLDAAEVIIWSDVDGIYSADPELVPEARVLPAVTYQEAAELSYYGAKVLHPKTLAPLVEKGIPVWAKSSFRPESPGTLIARRGTRGVNGGPGARAVTALKEAVLITIESNGQLSATALMARAFSLLAHERIDLLMLSLASREESFCFAVHARDAAAVRAGLEQAFAIELAHDYVTLGVQPGVGILALVGSGMRGTVGVAGKLFGALSGEGINIIAIAQGATETNISVAVDGGSLAAAVRAVHRALLEHPRPASSPGLAAGAALNCE